MKFEQIRASFETFQRYSYEQYDQIFHDVAMEISRHRIELAKLAYEETGLGIFEDKAIKNLFASENVYHAFKNFRPKGSTNNSVIKRPYGIIAAVLPVTNPTSTAIYKTLLALRTGNAIILLPHPKATKCTERTYQYLSLAAKKANVPEDIISFVPTPSKDEVKQIMLGSDLVWATGGAMMCQAAYETHRPSLIGGPGNCPAYIDESANIELAVSAILQSKTFDNGIICATEQSVVVHKNVSEKVKSLFQRHGAYLLNKQEAKILSEFMQTQDGLNKRIVGQSARKIAQLANISIDPKLSCRVLIGMANGEEIGEKDPWSWEKMAPVLAYYEVDTFEMGVDVCARLVENGGVGHVASIHLDPQMGAIAKNKLLSFEQKVPCGEVLVNIPSAQGVIGDLYNFSSIPRLSVQTNRMAGVPCEIAPDALLRSQQYAIRENHFQWIRLPSMIFFENNSTQMALESALNSSTNNNRIFLITDQNMEKLGYLEKIIHFFDSRGGKVQVFSEIEVDPSFSTVLKGIALIKNDPPGIYIALGGGSVMDAAKLIRLLMEHPNVTDLDSIQARFLDITKKIHHYGLPTHSKNATFVCIPTTSGTGSELTPFAVITDPRNGIKYAIADYVMTPTIAAIDASYVFSLPENQVAAPGVDAITHAIESYVSVLASEYTKAWSIHSLQLLFKHLPLSKKGDRHSRTIVHQAASMAAMSLANAFVGLAHSIAHQLGSFFHLHHGVACALALPVVIRFNNDLKGKQAYFPQHHSLENTQERYAQLAKSIGCGEKANADDLIHSFETLLEIMNMPKNFKQACPLVPKEKYVELIPQMAMGAFDDQCTGTNPRYPLVSEIEILFEEIF